MSNVPELGMGQEWGEEERRRKLPVIQESSVPHLVNRDVNESLSY